MALAKKDKYISLALPNELHKLLKERSEKCGGLVPYIVKVLINSL